MSEQARCTTLHAAETDKRDLASAKAAEQRALVELDTMTFEEFVETVSDVVKRRRIVIPGEIHPDHAHAWWRVGNMYAWLSYQPEMSDKPVALCYSFIRPDDLAGDPEHTETVERFDLSGDGAVLAFKALVRLSSLRKSTN
jgi:hypothetical protein